MLAACVLQDISYPSPDQVKHRVRPSFKLSSMTGAHLPVRIRSQEGAVIVSVSGELDLASVPIFMEATEKAIASDVGGGRLVLDLLDLSFMDSSGLGAILALAERHPAIQLALVVGDGIVEKVLETTAMHKLLKIVPSVAEALADD